VITHRTTILDIVDVMMVLRNGLLDMLGPADEVYHALQHQAAARRAQ
jgi:ABC-type protease/lipase transport system fused ATPase/permease subunit